MIKSDVELKLLANVPIGIDGIGQFQLPLVRDMITMDESSYLQKRNILLFSKDMLGDDEHIHQYSDYQVLMMVIAEDESFRELLFDAFKLFLSSEPIFYFDKVCFNQYSEETVFTEEKWEYLKNILRLSHYIQEPVKEEYKAGNSKARELIEFIRRKKSTEKPPEKVNLHSIVSAVAWRTTGIHDLLNLTIYQLYDAYYRLNQVDNYQQTISGIYTGIYTGNIDGSKMKMPDIDWANIIKLK